MSKTRLEIATQKAETKQRIIKALRAENSRLIKRNAVLREGQLESRDEKQYIKTMVELDRLRSENEQLRLELEMFRKVVAQKRF